MRPAGRSDTDSLYFTYPHFNAPGTEAKEATQSAAVAIVGAGPIGMTAALALAKQGIASVLFDNKSTFNDGSRAICIARPSYYILEQLGAIGPFLDKALGWTTGRTFYRGQKILEFNMPDGADEKFRPMYNLQQQYIEAFLWQAVEASEHIETRWQSEITGIEDTSHGVRLTVSDPAGDYNFDADWTLACDGAHSPIRKMRGKRLRGENFEGRYVIADIQMDHDYPTIRRALFDPACRPGGTVLIHRQPDNIWRIDYQLKDDESAEAALYEHTVRDSVTSVLKDIDYDGSWELEWWSVYTANTLALDDYRDGRVFFVGDSAHIVPIFGVRGLNNGLADAANIGWKLGWVIGGRAGPGLLDSYSPERRAATLDVFTNASKSARFMTPASHGWKLVRDAALSLAVNHTFAGELANPRQMTAFTYSGSPAVLDDDPAFRYATDPGTDELPGSGSGSGSGSSSGSSSTRGPSVGAVVPELKVGDQYLTDRLGAGFNILCFGDELAQELINAIGNHEFLEVVRLPPTAMIVFAATEHSAYLVRPDMHIAGRWKTTMAPQIIDAYQSATFRQTMTP